MFDILLTQSFGREFKKLDDPIRNQVKKKLQTISENPFHYFERLSGQTLFKLRIGKYRIIAQISLSKKQIILLSIGHRKKVYKKQ